MRTTKFVLLFLLGIAVLSCKKETSEEEQAEKDREVIVTYLADNNLEAKETASGLFYIIEDSGTGDKPSETDDVTVRYKGYFVDGKVFDQSPEEGITFNLQNVIEGWTEGIPLFREGGNGVLLIPSHLGYGTKGSQSGAIPGRTVIIFDVKLIEVVD